jgi:predicted PurR-regulated permease PerM
VIIGSVAIAFLTYFMLLDGPRMVERFYAVLPESARPRWQRVGHEIYRTVGGYVTGNILISVIAGVAAMVALFAVGSSYSVALAVVVAILDLVPLAGATMAAVIVSTVVFVELGWVKGVIIVASLNRGICTASPPAYALCERRRKHGSNSQPCGRARTI